MVVPFPHGQPFQVPSSKPALHSVRSRLGRAGCAFDASREAHRPVTCGYAVSFLNVTTNEPFICVDVAI